MAVLQAMNVHGLLNAKEFVIINDQTTSPLNIQPLNENIKLLLEIPAQLYSHVENLNPTKSGLFVGIE